MSLNARILNVLTRVVLYTYLANYTHRCLKNEISIFFTAAIYKAYIDWIFAIPGLQISLNILSFKKGLESTYNHT